MKSKDEVPSKAEGAGGKRTRLLMLWPRYEAGKEVFFRVFLENFETYIVFVASGSKGRQTNSDALGCARSGVVEDPDIRGLVAFKDRGRLSFWNFKDFRLSGYGLKDMLRLFQRLHCLLRKERWDLVLFSTQAPLHSKFAYLICRWRRINCACVVEAWEDYESRNPLMRLNKFLDKFIIKTVDTTFPHGAAAQAYCNRLRGPGRSIVLPYYIEDQYRDRYGSGLTKFVYCGGLSEKKNPLGIVRAFVASDILRSRARLVLAGEGSVRAEIEDFVYHNGAEDKVDLLGAYDAENLASILDTESVFVLPSLKDGWSFATLEAVCLGRPLILSTRVGAHHDLLRHGINGHLVQSGDIRALREAMETMVMLPASQAIEMQKASRRIFEEHNRKERVVSAIVDAATGGG